MHFRMARHIGRSSEFVDRPQGPCSLSPCSLSPSSISTVPGAEIPLLSNHRVICFDDKNKNVGRKPTRRSARCSCFHFAVRFPKLTALQRGCSRDHEWFCVPFATRIVRTGRRSRESLRRNLRMPGGTYEQPIRDDSFPRYERRRSSSASLAMPARAMRHHRAAERRDTLIAPRSERDGATIYTFDIHLQGACETVFFDV
jgi:hypothetical protein